MTNKLYKRYNNGGSMITDEGMRIFYKFADDVKTLIEEIEEDGSTVDLRDLQTILQSVVSDVIAHEIINRRLLGEPEDMLDREWERRGETEEASKRTRKAHADNLKDLGLGLKL